MQNAVTLLLGDSAEKLKEIPDASIDLVVTSPPYDNLRQYKGYSSKNSYIILQHDHRLDSVNLVPQIASIVKSNGFTIVSMDEYLG